MKIIRVFPRRTHATPDDLDVRINTPPDLFDEADEVHISVCFTWDIPAAERLAREWKVVAPVKVGGPAFNEPGGNFEPGRYLKHGYVITSRGCPNRCWFCKVPEREGYRLRRLPIREGWIVTDDNLLACGKRHINKVFDMLKRQPKRPQFTGGLEAKRLTPDMAVRLKELKPVSLFFAYDTPDDYAPLVAAGKMLREAGFKMNNHIARCFVLIGYRGDTLDKAELRLRRTWEAGFFPMAMLYRNDTDGGYTREWRAFQRLWARPHIVACKIKER
ncbi:MAG: hypothetical protein MdMp024_0947 [Bacteroidales bacterium]